MRNPLQYWPLLIVIIVSLCNIDLVIIPALKYRKVPLTNIFIVASFLGTIELIYWYWFWGWFADLIVNIKPNRVSNYFSKKIDSMSKKINRVGRWVRKCGFMTMILIGLLPEPGIRMIGVVFCRNTRWKIGFCSLIFGNILHIGYVVGGWNFIFNFFGT